MNTYLLYLIPILSIFVNLTIFVILNRVLIKNIKLIFVISIFFGYSFIIYFNICIENWEIFFIQSFIYLCMCFNP